MINKIFVFVLCLASIWACNSSSTADTKSKATNTSKQVSKKGTNVGQQPTALIGDPIPAMEQDFFMNLFKKVDGLDYVFYDLPFSMSQTDLTAVQANIGFIATNGPGGVLSSCEKALGRKFFKHNGEIIAEAEMYFSEHCKFYVFIDDNNKKIYANNMTQEGINFYNNIMKQVQGTPNQ